MKPFGCFSIYFMKGENSINLNNVRYLENKVYKFISFCHSERQGHILQFLRPISCFFFIQIIGIIDSIYFIRQLLLYFDLLFKSFIHMSKQVL